MGDLAANYGLTLMSDYMLSLTASEFVREFFEKGTVPITEELIAGFKTIHCTDQDIADTIDKLMALLAKYDMVAIISDETNIVSPELTIQRRTHEIGGSRVEICSNSGETV